MPRCTNKVDQTVPSGFDYKIVEMQCGNTSIYGEPLYCESCDKKHKSAGHLPHECSHGHDMRPEGAFCNACEYG